MRIGIDIGGTNIGIGLVDCNLNILYKNEFPTEKEKGYDYIKLKIIKEIEKTISRAGDYFLDKINKVYLNYILFKNLNYAEIKLSTLGNDAGIVGAAMVEKYK